MRIARLARRNGSTFFAHILGTEAHVLDGAPWETTEANGRVVAPGQKTGERIPLSLARLRCPVVPSKILCIGRNYAAHAKELGHEVPAEPLLFLKPPSSLLDPDGVVVLPRESERVEHEAEVGVVIGKRARNVAKEAALDYVLGYTCVGDITARDLQRKDGQWSRAKGFDTFCPTGPWIETDCDPSALRVVCRVNGAVRQDGLTTQMMFDVPTLIAYASRMMTLEPGDLLVTGTPEGVGPLVSGDVLEIEVAGATPASSGVGTLSLRVASTA